MSTPQNPDGPQWPHQLYDALRAGGVSLFAYVPDGGHKVMINRAIDDQQATAIPLTTEEEGVALLCGAHLGDAKGVLLMQSSGAGNCINMLSLAAFGRFPILMIVTMRGQWGEFNPWQVQMGRSTETVLEAVGVKCFPVDKAEEVGETFAGAAGLAFNGGFSTAVLISQRIIGAKGFGQE